MAFSTDFQGAPYAAIQDARNALYAEQQASLVAYDANPAANPAPTGAALDYLLLVVGDETTAITTGTNKFRVRIPYKFKLTDVRGSLNVASSAGIPTIDVNEAGTSVLSTKVTFDATETTTATAVAAEVISDTIFATDAEISVDVDVAGTGAAGLKLWLVGYRI